MSTVIDLLQHNTVSSFIQRQGLVWQEANGSVYLYNRSVMFKIYVHLGTLYFDVIFPLTEKWAWDVDSLIQEIFDDATYDTYRSKAACLVSAVDGLSSEQVWAFLTEVLILDSEMSDLLSGQTVRYSNLLQPLTTRQKEEIRLVQNSEK